MGLGHAIAEALNVDPQHVMLLRHSNAKIAELRRRNIPVHENYTCVQPTNSRYDYFAKGKPVIEIVVVIVNDKVDGVYRVHKDICEGTTRTLVSKEFAQFDRDFDYGEHPAKRFCLQEAGLIQIHGRPIQGWRSPRCPTARYGERLFDSVSLSEFGEAT